MSWKKFFVTAFLSLLICLLISGCKVRTEDRQGKKRERRVKDFFIFFVRDNKEKKAIAPTIWYMSSDGTNQRKASFGGETIHSKGSFSISKDGQRIAWSPPAVFSSINTMNINGLHREIILQANLSSNTEYLEPSFSPDGKRITFTATEWKEPGVSASRTYTGRINIDKSDLTKFVPNPYGAKFAEQPSYSPDGSRIILTLKFSNESSQIIVINSISGEVIRELTPKEFLDSEPVYTPDGRSIVFVSNRTGKENIFIMKDDGTDVKQLTFKKKNKNPSISPDGKRIALSSNRDGNWEIYVMNIDGTKEKRLTKNRVDDYHPEWCKRI